MSITQISIDGPRGNTVMQVRGSPIRIGSSSSCEVVLTGFNIEPIHAALHLGEERMKILCHAPSGALLNGMPFLVAPFRPKCDKLTIHNYQLRFTSRPLPVQEAPSMVHEGTAMYEHNLLAEGNQSLHYLENGDLQVFPLNSPLIRIGQHRKNDLVLNDGYISAHHCQIKCLSGATYLEDLSSTNGTYLNGLKVGRCELSPGARILIGRTLLRIQPAHASSAIQTIIGRSTAMRKVIELIRLYAATEVSVLIQGETGTGKELVARALHDLSPRRGRPFIPVNCAAISSELMESELFGHQRGAFTGAQNARPGLFEEADGGVLFLDEIGDLPLLLQAKLLRAIEQGEIRRVGANRIKQVNIRFIAATNRPLTSMCRQKLFRKDLYHRLSIGTIEIPAMRERLEDIPRLAAHFLWQEGDGTYELSAPALTKLLHHNWPGNVRELRHVLIRAMILSNSAQLGTKDIIFNQDTELSENGRELSLEPRILTLKEIERRAILEALEKTGWNRTAAARVLGIAKSTLFDRVKRYKLNHL